MQMRRAKGEHRPRVPDYLISLGDFHDAVICEGSPDCDGDDGSIGQSPVLRLSAGSEAIQLTRWRSIMAACQELPCLWVVHA